MPRLKEPDEHLTATTGPYDWEEKAFVWVKGIIWLIVAGGLVLAVLRVAWWGFTGD